MARMAATLHRRGPDRQAVHCQGNAGFAHALLATTPEAHAERQPWVHPDSGCIVVSDSRLDHRPELLRQLGITRPADDVGDGELLNAAWQRWGSACADRLRGDFAFAIWNPAQQTLFCARDPMGVRPFLFHFRAGHRFVFGSSSAAVLAQGDVPTHLDEGRIADALIGETEGIDQTSTFYSRVQRLPPASWLRLRDGVLEQQRYWRPVQERPVGLPRSEREWIEAQRDQLDRAVRLRLRSHRPVGSMLSGGLDSSSVVALASQACTQAGQAPLSVFSATHDADPDCLETRYIRAVVGHVRCAPTYVDLADFEDAGTRQPPWWEHAGEPFDGTMAMGSALYHAASALGTVSLMDGVPADNLFAVGRYAQRLAHQGRWADSWRAAQAQWQLPGVDVPRWHALRVMAGCVTPEPVHEARRWVGDRRLYRELLRESLIAPDFARRVDLWRRFRRYSQTVGGSHQWHPTEEALSTLAAPYITAGIERYNRVASLHGVEPRPVYADRDLIEFQAWMPLALRIRDGHAKWVLRQAMAADLPAPVVWRTDKSHVGWRFNLVWQQHYSRSVARALSGSPFSGWVDQARLRKALEARPAVADEGLQAALRLALWIDAQAAAAPCPDPAV
jgi:asparagine synthase (glutamine-hydrolysing)